MSNVWNDDHNSPDMPVELDAQGNWVETPVGGPPIQEPVRTSRPRAPAMQPKLRGRAAPAPQPVQARPVSAPQPEPEIEYDVEAMESQEEDDFSDVLNDANLRLEQGTLYKMVMNSNLFQDMNADPRAVKNVEREIKRFARERMEIMLGMRQERSQEVQHVTVASPFNGLEVAVLKQVAAAASKGATERPEAEEIAQKIEKKTSLTPISGAPRAAQPQATLTPARPAPAPAPKPQPKPLPQKPAAPLDRSARKSIDILDLEVNKRLDPKLAEQLIDAVMDGSGKDTSLMTEDELIEHNRLAGERRKPRVSNPRALPTMSVEQSNQLATAQGSDPKMQNSIAQLMVMMGNKK